MLKLNVFKLTVKSQTKLAFAHWKATVETQGKGMKYVQS